MKENLLLYARLSLQVTVVESHYFGVTLNIFEFSNVNGIVES